MSEVFIDDTPENRRYFRLLDKLEECGWQSSGRGNLKKGTVRDTFVAPEGFITRFSTDDIKIELCLVGDKGAADHAYSFSTEPESGQTVIEYDGPFTNDYAMTLQLMEALAERLDDIESLRARRLSDPEALRAYWATKYANNIADAEL